MKKWIWVLALALCFACAHAEGEDYYTNNKDIYYHTDPDCDRPEVTTWYGQQRILFERACYEKYPISEEAALEFEKRACPICVKETEAVYLGDHMMAWGHVCAPWGIGGNVRSWGDPPLGSEEYRAEVEDTYDRFSAYYGANGDRRPYPDVFAGMWKNNADGYSYAFVDPTQELMDAFQSTFGGGAWIVPAKYGENEMRALQKRIFEILNEWIDGHPELDIHPSIAMVGTDELEVGLYGADWEEALSMIDGEIDLPIWVCFVESGPITAAAEDF